MVLEAGVAGVPGFVIPATTFLAGRTSWRKMLTRLGLASICPLFASLRGGQTADVMRGILWCKELGRRDELTEMTMIGWRTEMTKFNVLKIVLNLTSQKRSVIRQNYIQRPLKTRHCCRKGTNFKAFIRRANKSFWLAQNEEF
jgi:hypothetical protein